MQRTIKHAPARPKFEAVFVNGVHTVFNREVYSHGPALRTAKEARAVAEKLSSGQLQWSVR